MLLTSSKRAFIEKEAAQICRNMLKSSSVMTSLVRVSRRKFCKGIK